MLTRRSVETPASPTRASSTQTTCLRFNGTIITVIFRYYRVSANDGCKDRTIEPRQLLALHRLRSLHTVRLCSWRQAFSIWPNTNDNERAARAPPTHIWLT